MYHLFFYSTIATRWHLLDTTPQRLITEIDHMCWDCLTSCVVDHNIVSFYFTVSMPVVRILPFLYSGNKITPVNLSICERKKLMCTTDHEN